MGKVSCIVVRLLLLAGLLVGVGCGQQQPTPGPAPEITSKTDKDNAKKDDAKKDDAILASLPFFHSFGSTVTLWYPLIEGVRIVTYPNPLEAAKNAALIERYKLTLLLATPTFLRGYLRKVEPHQLRSLRLVITGAEKLPLDLGKAFEERFKQRVFEGYGLTETAPVVSVASPIQKSTGR